MTSFLTLLDAPGTPASRIQIARLGPVKDPRYGDFEITADNVANWRKNLSALPGGRALIDFEHRSEKAPRDSKAAGWITNISLDGEKVMADAEWSDEGADAIRNKRYLFLSPAYGSYSNERGETFDDTLMSTALTNKPVLGSLPMLTLASDERVSAWLADDAPARTYDLAITGALGETARALVMLDVPQAERDEAAANHHALPDGSYPIGNATQLHAAAVLAASHHGDWQAAQKLIRRRASELGVDITTLPGFATTRKLDAPSDSRATMSQTLDTGEILKTLGLDENADQTKVLEAITALRDRPEPAEPAEPKTLEQQAAENGMVLLDAAAVQTLQRQAAAGEAAQKQLHEQRFETAFLLALEDPKGPRVTPAEKESLQHFYALDADATIAMIDAREPRVPAKPAGNPVLTLDDNASPDQLAAAGVHPDNHDLHKRITGYLLENKLPESDYVKVLDQYTKGQVQL